MKHFFALASIAAFTVAADATVHIVTCQNGTSHFLPITVNANVGDTIHWTWVSGNHVVGPVLETDIPALADTWYGLINSTYNTFDYVIAYPGSYHYVCHPNSPHGEDGYIEVAVTTVVPGSEPLSGGAVIYPDPFSDAITVEATGATSITLHNLLGEEVGSFAFTNDGPKLLTELGTLPKGIYFCSLRRGGVVLETKRLVKQ